MEKLLNQEEIDALVRAMRGGRADGKEQGVGQRIEKCTFRQAGQLTSAQVRTLSSLNDAYARNVTHAVSAYLRAEWECALMSVEQIRFNDVLGRIPDLSYLATFTAGPEHTGLLQIDLNLIFPLIDLVLGGQGKPEKQLRELTTIEEEVIQGTIGVLCRELHTAWNPLALTFEFQQRQPAGALTSFMAPNEQVLALVFEMRLPEVRGNLNLVFPSELGTELLRRHANFEWKARRTPARAANTRMLELLSQCPFMLELKLNGAKVSAGELAGLAPGAVLRLSCDVEHPVTAVVGNRPFFSGSVVRSGKCRAAQLTQSA
jgi:flagellar motor switch protein FliM